MERDLVEYMAKSLVDDPSGVSVKAIESDGAVVLELRVATSDLGKVIGKQGRIAKAMRTVLAAATARTGKRFNLEIVE
jgi:hypothetical protein